MRIIAGDMKGRTLHVPRQASFRPTTDRVKEALFNILHGLLAWEDCRVCDLFAGSGSLGLEALSRGAHSATFVERNRDHRLVLQRNIDRLGVGDRTRVMPMRAEKFLASESAAYDFVCADPPYDYADYEALLTSCEHLVKTEGIVTIEHAVRTQLPDVQPFFTLDRREYGTTAVSIFRFQAGEDAS